MQFLKDNVIPILTMVIVSVGLVTTAVNTGRASGRVEQKVIHLEEQSIQVAAKIDTAKEAISTIKEEQAFLKGQVITQLSSIQISVNKIEKRVDKWEVVK